MRIIPLAFSVLALAGCTPVPKVMPPAPTKMTGRLQPAVETTMIRLQNASPFSLTNIQVDFNGQVESFGNLRPAEGTDYRSMRSAHRYARIKASVDGRPVVMQPQDFLGEPRLGWGYFTYRLTADPVAGSISIELVADPVEWPMR